MVFKFIIHPDSYLLADYLTNYIRRKIKHNKKKKKLPLHVSPMPQLFINQMKFHISSHISYQNFQYLKQKKAYQQIIRLKPKERPEPELSYRYISLHSLLCGDGQTD
jgi:hypothetical protein